MADLVALTREWLDIIAAGRFDDWGTRVAEDVVFRLPFAPPGAPEEMRGIETARETLRATWDGKKHFAWHDMVIRRTDDPDLVVTTARSEAEFVSGKRYANSYVIFTRFRDGMVVEHVEYLNPLKVLEAFDLGPSAA
jgi:ketosteroid isomerase-like protein